MMRADARAELLERTGVRVEAADFCAPGHGKATWLLSVVAPLPGADPRIESYTKDAGSSVTFRKPKLLNALLWKLGRDESLPRLTADDGHRILALLRTLAGVEVPR